MEDKNTFDQLKAILSSLGKGLEIKKDQADYYYLNTNQQIKKKDVFFGAVQIRKSYVAYHLYPVYTHPELLDQISDNLKKRMQGKSCFNFKKGITDEHLSELKELTEKSYQKYVEIEYLKI